MVLKGISNWINNCLIPISQLDLSAQTEEAVSYGKESKKEWEGERLRDVERHGQIQEKKGSTKDSVLEIDKDKVKQGV